jgi:hypothetical protein
MTQVILQNKIQKDYSVFKSLVDGSISSVTQDMIEGITKIDDYAFYNCETLTSIQIPNSVTDIKKYSFYGCSSLTNIAIPNSVSTIGNDAFEISGLTNIVIPNSITSMGNSVFYYCHSLESVTLSNNLTTIPQSIFSGCNKLTNITVPDGITSIGAYAFSGCSSLTNLTIPSTVTSIGDGAFQVFSDPQRTITLLSVTPPTITSLGPFNCPTNNVTIYVPAESLDTYKSGSMWAAYASKIQAIPS